LASRPEIGRLLAGAASGAELEGDGGVVASCRGGATLVISGATERGVRTALWDLLGRIEAPLPNDDLRVEELAAPGAIKNDE